MVVSLYKTYNRNNFWWKILTDSGLAKGRNIAQNLIQLLATLFAFDCKDYETNMKFP